MLLAAGMTETLRHHPENCYEHHSVNLPCTLVMIGHHLKAGNQFQTVLRNISFSGALLDLNGNMNVEDNFFLEIDGIRDEIGCTKVSQNWHGITVQFNMLLNDQFLDHVLYLASMMRD